MGGLSSSVSVLAVTAVLVTLAVANTTENAGRSPALAVATVAETPGQSYRQETDAEKVARPQATTDTSNAPCRTVADCPPPPPRSRFVSDGGFFSIPRWDDREISDAAKAADPWRDPFWPAFVQCMQAGGVGLGITTPEAATQADIDLLVAEVNKSGPAYLGTPRGLEYQPSPAADVFRSCETILYEQRPPSSP